MNKLNNLDVDYFKIPKKHRERNEMPSRAACLKPLLYTLLGTCWTSQFQY